MRPRIQHLQRLESVSIPYQTIRHSSRFVHSSARKHASAAQTPTPESTPISPILSDIASLKESPQQTRTSATLARVPTSNVLRSYLIMGMSSSPTLLSLCFAILQRILDSKSALLSIERNPVLARLLKSTFYAQFCAGENKQELKANATKARDVLGYNGIIVEYALEVLAGEGEITEAETQKEIEIWRKGMLESIEIAKEGDFVGLKLSGLGRQALRLLQRNADPTPAMQSAIDEACDAASAKNVALLPGAEEEITNTGLQQWSLALQKKYNTPSRGKAIMYCTYQCYLKSTPSVLAQHLAKAQEGGYIAGVKLVRGAYMNYEPRRLIWENKEGTDACYDACAEAVLRGTFTDVVKAPAEHPTSEFPDVNVVLATHNYESVKKAQRIREEQVQRGEKLKYLTFAQLQGMADEITQGLVQEVKSKGEKETAVVKCMAWGTTTECLHFLLRRAVENKQAMGRTVETRRAMGKELRRRIKAFFGLA